MAALFNCLWCSSTPSLSPLSLSLRRTQNETWKCLQPRTPQPQFSGLKSPRRRTQKRNKEGTTSAVASVTSHRTMTNTKQPAKARRSHLAHGAPITIAFPTRPKSARDAASAPWPHERTPSLAVPQFTRLKKFAWRSGKAGDETRNTRAHVNTFGGKTSAAHACPSVPGRWSSTN